MDNYKTIDLTPSRRIRRVLRRRTIGDGTLVAMIVDIELTPTFAPFGAADDSADPRTLLEEESDVRNEVLPRLRTFAG